MSEGTEGVAGAITAALVVLAGLVARWLNVLKIENPWKRPADDGLPASMAARSGAHLVEVCRFSDAVQVNLQRAIDAAEESRRLHASPPGSGGELPWHRDKNWERRVEEGITRTEKVVCDLKELIEKQGDVNEQMLEDSGQMRRSLEAIAERRDDPPRTTELVDAFVMAFKRVK